jgi:protein-tyrosine phosphatase
MTEVLPWQATADRLSIVEKAVAKLSSGGLVAFPTETVYGVAASARELDPIDRLKSVKGRKEEKPLTLAVADTLAALEWVPRMPQVGRRLARRAWPGPLTLVFDDLQGGCAAELSESVRHSICPEGTLGIRVPDHDAIRLTLQRLPDAVVFTSANLSGAAAAVTADEVRTALGDRLDLVIDGGRCRYGLPSTVVRVSGESWQILREGALPRNEMERLAATIILFVCTGNTCRSPMAEALCKRLLADRLGCRPEELPRRGFWVLSAGLSAIMGTAAAPEALASIRKLGADLTEHSGRPLSANLLAHADHVIAMTRAHQEALLAYYPGLGSEPRLLSPQDEDLPDPIGEPQEVYDQCASKIRGYLQGWLSEFQVPEANTGI